MTEKIRLGFVGADHLHFHDLLKNAFACPTAEVVGAVITDPELREFFAEQYVDLSLFDDIDEFYAAANPQAIVTCANNRDALAVVADAAQRGVHVMKEKHSTK